MSFHISASKKWCIDFKMSYKKVEQTKIEKLKVEKIPWSDFFSSALRVLLTFLSPLIEFSMVKDNIYVIFVRPPVHLSLCLSVRRFVGERERERYWVKGRDKDKRENRKRRMGGRKNKEREKKWLNFQKKILLLKYKDTESFKTEFLCLEHRRQQQKFNRN